MGNSPSRNELQDHMSGIVNNSSGQETFQSHSYPAKFPGIHDTRTTPPAGAHHGGNVQTTGKNGSRGSSGGPNTPDLLYSMDSLNVCGNNSTSITSAELPPSSISPANGLDPWRREGSSSFSEESLLAQRYTGGVPIREKEGHYRHRVQSRTPSDDLLTSSSTYESDSLNPDATLSGMTQDPLRKDGRITTPPNRGAKPQSTLLRREQSPGVSKPEIAEEATEMSAPVGGTSAQYIDHSITINGRKVSACKETPLPIIAGLQKHAEIINTPDGGGECMDVTTVPSPGVPSTKSSPPPLSTSNGGGNGIYSTGTIKRGRMKSPPPPPPPSKATVVDNVSPIEKAPVESCDKMSTLNSLMRRNCTLDNRKPSPLTFEKVDERPVSTEDSLGGMDSCDTSVTPTPISPTPASEDSARDSGDEKRSRLSSSSRKSDESPRLSVSEGEPLVESGLKGNLSIEEEGGYPREPGALVDPVHRICTQVEAVSPLPPETATLFAAGADKTSASRDRTTDIAIRPCEASTESQAPLDESEDNRKQEVRPILEARIEVGVGQVQSEGTVSAQAQYGEDSAREADNVGKTELDCKDGERDYGAASDEERKPVCSSASDSVEEEEEKKKDEGSLIDEPVLVVVGRNGSKSESLEGTEETEAGQRDPPPEKMGEGAVEFPEMSDSQLDTSFGSRNAPQTSKMMRLFESKEGQKVPRSEQHLEGKVGTDDKEQQRSGRRGAWSREGTPPSSSPVVVATTETVMSLLQGTGATRSGSNCSSRRGSLSSSSSASFVELNPGAVTASGGILNCNRISLCSLPDNEMDVDAFESPPPPVLDSETIRAQPLAWSPVTNSESALEQEGGLVEEETKEGEVPGTALATHANSNGSSSHHGHQRKASLAKINFDCGTLPGEKRLMTSSAPTANSLAHPKSGVSRKTSFPELFVNTAPSQSSEERSCIERRFSVGSSEMKPPRQSHFRGSCQNIMTGVDPEADSNITGRRGKFAKNDFLQTLGEIYASKSKMLKSKAQEPPSLAADPSLEGHSVTMVPRPVSSNGSLNPAAAAASLSTLAPAKARSRESSIDTVEGFESQDRSISEYNISPRSARQLVNGSLGGTPPSQVSIVTVDKREESPGRTLLPVLTVPLSPTFNDDDVGERGNPAEMAEVLLPGLVTQSPSITNGAPPLFNSGTYKKKPTFGRPPPGAKGDSMSVPVETHESSCSAPKTGQEENVRAEEMSSCFPAPPPMPPLQYSHQSSSSSSFEASSTLTTPSFSLVGESSAPSLNKSRSPSIPGDNDQSMSTICSSGSSSSSSKLTCRFSPDRTATPKMNGNCIVGSSVECSLVELSLATKRSTSDAIIVELKKAQAKKLGKFAESKSSTAVDTLTERRPDLAPDGKGEVDSTTIPFVQVAPPSCGALQPPRQWSRNSASRQNSESKRNGLPENGCPSVVSVEHRGTTVLPSDNSTSPGDSPSSTHDVGEPTVKAIVNGKHANSIIVNDSGTGGSGGKRESFLRRPVPSGLVRGGGGVSGGGKASIAQPPRGNIMSPSLSGNYKEMNGIDSETMGASSNHEDEVSGQLQQQQKENHINNENDGNVVVDEIQTSNKLDGASFRRVLSEYEKTLSMFIQQIDQLKQRMDEAETEKQTLIKERDQALEDLRNVESAFSDVHRKYERAKALLENMKSNEDTLIRRDHEMMQRIQNRDKKIDMIKEKAQESIEKMHLDYETRIKEMDFENAKLRAQYRKMEMKLSTLENDVEQKAKENAQLSALCDELINGQVGQV